MTDGTVHIGVEKTGSTSVQMTMARNRAELKALGLLYPRSLGERNQTKAYAFASQGSMDELKTAVGLRSVEDIQEFRQKVRSDLAREVNERRPARIVVSNEHLSSRLTRPSEVERLANLLRRHCQAIRVLVYIRPQGEALRSAYSTYIKTGGTARFAYPNQAEISAKYDYETLLDLWAGEFGEEAIDVRIFDRRDLAGGDVVTDFLQYLGLGLAALAPAREMNKSLGRASMEFLRRFNAFVPYTLGTEFNPARGNIQEVLEEFADDPPWEGDAEIMRALEAALAASNERVRRRFFADRPAPLFAPAAPEPASAAAEPDEDEVIRAAAHAWQVKQAQVLRLRAKLDGAVETQPPARGGGKQPPKGSGGPRTAGLQRR